MNTSINDYTTILTYEDACAALGERVDEEALAKAGASARTIAQMKCELVAKAINGGKIIKHDCVHKAWEAIFLSYNNLSDAIRCIARHGERQFSAVYAYDALQGEKMICGPIAGYIEPECFNGDIDPRKDVAYFETPEKARHFGLNFMDMWLDAHVENFSYDKTAIFRVKTTPKERGDEEQYASAGKDNRRKIHSWWWIVGTLILVLTFCLGRLILARL